MELESWWVITWGGTRLPDVWMGYNAIVSYLELNTTTSCLALWGSTCWYQDRVIVFFGCVYVYIYSTVCIYGNKTGRNQSKHSWSLRKRGVWAQRANTKLHTKRIHKCIWVTGIPWRLDALNNSVVWRWNYELNIMESWWCLGRGSRIDHGPLVDDLPIKGGDFPLFSTAMLRKDNLNVSTQWHFCNRNVKKCISVRLGCNLPFKITKSNVCLGCPTSNGFQGGVIRRTHSSWQSSVPDMFG